MRALIWDLGGTLVDTYPDVDRALASALGVEVDDALLAEVGALTRVSSGQAITALATRYDVPAEVLRAAYEATKDHWEQSPPPVMDGARELMAAVLEAGGLNLVATHRERTSATALLDQLGLEVDGMVCAPDGFARKPDPAMTLALLAEHDLDPAECLAVGDRPADVEAAEAAGVEGWMLVTPGIPLTAPGDRRTLSLRTLIPLFAASDQP
ncbi:HAD-IA family hydrolase [Brachybacterium aquaticum]|uniref:HAD superfamily hydrolase (TIGR01509 family) n=1 Tax=Brachybacterium aquaticum TaxID=1432564 RepID=A0A841ADQ4_9MICO|nr:HAD-IA family hydrolase [Brachybacterium aquaticum]MBB5831485.1 HAD superfamily hydrolase (TIGR01509 family) [Brachybacterium aquaticum]